MPELMFFRYADDNEATLIKFYNRIEPKPSAKYKWYTPDFFETGTDAKHLLALDYTPTHRIGPIPESYFDFDHQPLKAVEPDDDNGEPGGGLEAATTKVVHLFSMARIC